MNKYYTINKVFKIKMKEGTMLQTHLDEMSSLFAQIDDLGVIFEEDLRVIAILSSLLDSWETVRTTLNAASKSLPSLNTVIPKLLDAERLNLSTLKVLVKHWQFVRVVLCPEEESVDRVEAEDVRLIEMLNVGTAKGSFA